MLSFYKAKTAHYPLMLGFYNVVTAPLYPLMLSFYKAKTAHYPLMLGFYKVETAPLPPNAQFL